MPPSYAERASAAFLAGLPHSSPAEAVAAGVRSLAQWSEALASARAEVGLLVERPLREVKSVALDELLSEEVA